jgi:etoposide-induced 2.4 mRNA
MSLDRRVGFMQDRVAYMAGFGIPATLITSFGPPLVNMAIFALLYPIVSLLPLHYELKVRL